MANISDVEAANIARFLGRKGREVTIADVKEMPQVQVDKLKKQIAERKEQLVQTLASGGIQNYEDYQKVVGEISGLSFTEFLISDLHKDIEDE